MKAPTPSPSPLPGDTTHREAGFSYLSRFLSAADIDALIRFFATLHPQWEKRHAEGTTSSRGGRGLTRPVYWLGAWQFAALGYYSEPEHVENKCVRAEPLPPVLLRLLERLRPELERHGNDQLPNTCLINFYGHTPKRPGHPPVDRARLRMHRDGEPGPIVMFSIGQPAQFEFIDPDQTEPARSQWIRNRSAVVFSGPHYKDHLYHRITRVRYGDAPVITAQIDDFCVRRVSISFRHVPPERILDLHQLPPAAQEIIRLPIEALSLHSQHFRDQLRGSPGSG